jgi:putative DNA methylase
MIIENIVITEVFSPHEVVAFSLKDAPALIESLLPVQKLSIDVYKERMAGAGQTLTSLGSYWKGRKPLVLNRACVLAALLPATNKPVEDLEIFELLMGMDDVSLSKRLGLAKPEDILRCLPIERIEDYFVIDPPELARFIPSGGFVDLKLIPYFNENWIKPPTLKWRNDINEAQQHALAAQLLTSASYRELARDAKRAEEIPGISAHIWSRVNAHLGTSASSFPELTEQLGIMRFGRRPRVADTFTGSGQIPFAAAQLGCDVYASDLNPISCMLTWGAFNIVGGSDAQREAHEVEQQRLANTVKATIDTMEVETDGAGWRGKVYLYCLEVTCPSSGWKVPVLPTLAISKGKCVAARLVPDPVNKRYDIAIIENASAAQMAAANKGTYQKGNLVHTVAGVEHINAISAIRGDYTEKIGGKKVTRNALRPWEKSDIVPLPDDIYQERLYAIQWLKDDGSKRPEAEFRAVTAEDLGREQKVIQFVKDNLSEWQLKGYVPDTKIEKGTETERLGRERGWTYWHHLFNPRQLLTGALVREHLSASGCSTLTAVVDKGSKLSRWDNSAFKGGGGNTTNTFDNQALNPLFNYGQRGIANLWGLLTSRYPEKPLPETLSLTVANHAANEISVSSDIFITDPPYGDAVKYEEILEFFIGWLRKNPPEAFSGWTWDSRRELAVKGEDHDFKLAMVAAYTRMAECMPDNGMQVIMFTHQDGGIWADMANIVWASGLRVSAAWYIVTETDSALRSGSYVKGTILLVVRKRKGSKRTNQSDLSYELEDEVAQQVKRLTGLNDEVVAHATRPNDGNLFEDADLQMAGYAAALQVLTKYSIIDGKDMAQEALRPRTPGKKLLVDELIDFAVATANNVLVPRGLEAAIWQGLSPAERFYLKMLDMESRGLHALDNYQNFAMAFSVRDMQALMGCDKANEARLRSAVEFGRAEMAEDSELFNTATRAVLYALMELQAEKDIDDVLAGLPHNLPGYYSERLTVSRLAAYIAKKTESTRPEEASAARVLATAIETQRL